MKTKVLIACTLLWATAISHASAQSWLELLNSGVQKATELLSQGETLNVDNLSGTWTYSKPVCRLESDSQLAAIGGKALEAGIESQLVDLLSKVGITAGCFSCTLKNDGTFTGEIGGKSFAGRYTPNAANQTITFSGQYEQSILPSTEASASLTSNQLTILFKADKLIDALKSLSSLSQNQTLQTASSLLSQYNGMMLGLELTK